MLSFEVNKDVYNTSLTAVYQLIYKRIQLISLKQKRLLDADVSIVGVEYFRLREPLQSMCDAGYILDIETDVKEWIKRVGLGMTLQARHCNDRQTTKYFKPHKQVTAATDKPQITSSHTIRSLQRQTNHKLLQATQAGHCNDRQTTNYFQPHKQVSVMTDK